MTVTVTALRASEEATAEGEAASDSDARELAGTVDDFAEAVIEAAEEAEEAADEASE